MRIAAPPVPQTAGSGADRSGRSDGGARHRRQRQAATCSGSVQRKNDSSRGAGYRLAMTGPHRIEGYAIVSANGMIADSNGVMPDAIRNDADQRFLQAGLDRAAAVVHGRHSHEGGPRAAARKRIVATRQIASLAPDHAHPHAVLWNPAGATLEQALAALGGGDGPIAVIGGTEIFGLFLPRYDAFHLTRAAYAQIPNGLPVFPGVGPQATPEDVLARHGLHAGPRRDIDATAGITLTTWERSQG
jgi:dihydrofolate reductase